MDRRNFIGSVIGAAFGAEFLALLPDAPANFVPPEVVTLPYRMLFKDAASGFTVQAPAVVSVTREGNIFTFKSAPLSCKKVMELSRSILLTPGGAVIKDRPFLEGPARVEPGDTLTVSHAIEIHGKCEITSVEELVDMILTKKIT